MKTKTIKLYEYSELSPEAKKRAHQNYLNDFFDEQALQVHLDNEIEPLLKQYGIVPVSTADKKYDSKYAKIWYSLSNCQGDGVMFEGTFEWENHSITVKQSGHYNHSYSKTVEWNDHAQSERQEERFEQVYQAICKKLEKEGYSFIDELQNEAYFIEECNANEWTFRENGVMEN